MSDIRRHIESAEGRKRNGKKEKVETSWEMDRVVEEYFADQDAPTITGLVLALGFMSRQSLVDYDG